MPYLVAGNLLKQSEGGLHNVMQVEPSLDFHQRGLLDAAGYTISKSGALISMQQETADLLVELRFRDEIEKLIGPLPGKRDRIYIPGYYQT